MMSYTITVLVEARLSNSLESLVLNISSTFPCIGLLSLFAHQTVGGKQLSSLDLPCTT